MRRAFVYRLYPNHTQCVALQSLLDIARDFYNAALQERRDAWRMQGVSRNYYDQAAEIRDTRIETSWCAVLNYSATQDVLRRVDKTFAAFFRRVKAGEKAGYPRFKSRDRFDSVTFPAYGDGVRLGEKLYVQNVGRMRIKLHRSLCGEVKTVTLKRICGHWCAVFSCEVGDAPPKRDIESAVGIDVGLESFAVLSDGSVIQNPRYFRHGEEILADRQRRLSTKHKGSRRRRKARLLVAKAHNHICNQRRDFLHKAARQVVTRCDLIAYEDLNIRGMVRNHCLAKSISDAAWGTFLGLLCYKAEEAGSTVIAVNPRRTSQDCSWCGFPVSKTLADRVHSCPNCGVSVSRDLNASRNILRLGLSLQAPGLRSSPL